MSPFFLLSMVILSCWAHPNVYNNDNDAGRQLFNPLNYLDQLPSLSLPYINNLPIPNVPLANIVKPTPAYTTKVINVVTKYVSRTPMCIKLTDKRKPPCKHDGESHKRNEHIITKEYFVNHGRQAKSSKATIEAEHLRKLRAEIDAAKNNRTSAPAQLQGSEVGRIRRSVKIESLDDFDDFDDEESDEDDAAAEEEDVEDATPNLQADQQRKLLAKKKAPAPPLAGDQLRDLLIEDRLDRLEDVLPHYTRMRVYQTSTITVTRTRMARMATATLMVRNCVPDGIAYCGKRKKQQSAPTNKRKKTTKRKSKVAVEQTPAMPNYSPYYYG